MAKPDCRTVWLVHPWLIRMTSKDRLSPKEHYQQMRVLSCEELWSDEVPKFDQASPRDRISLVGIIRAVGVVFSESGSPAQKDEARQWLQSLLQDPEEKVRRYAMVALPKIGAAAAEEGKLLSLLKKTSSDREKKFLAQTLEKIGGAATLEATTSGDLARFDRTAQKVEANLARQQSPTSIRFDATCPDIKDLLIHLRGRSGLETIIEQEVQSSAHRQKFRVTTCIRSIVAVQPLQPFSLADIYDLRCFSEASLVLGTVKQRDNEVATIEALAKVIASPSTHKLLAALTDGPIRYRLEFASLGHQRSGVRQLSNRVYALNPQLLNDSRNAPWEINIYHTPQGLSVELTPKLRPDPRFAYRRRDIPAASHPPLAACIAHLAEPEKGDTVWDPFCGSGLELIERAILGQVGHLFGTDRSDEAIAIAQQNLAASPAAATPHTFACCDFRDYAKVDALRHLSLIVTNPPMGRRVPVANLKHLIEDLFVAASETLQVGGRLVFANPLPTRPRDHTLKLEFRQKVDLGGFHCHLEKYVKLDPRTPRPSGRPERRERPTHSSTGQKTSGPAKDFRPASPLRKKHGWDNMKPQHRKGS